VRTDSGGKHTFQDTHGGILNWWPSTGTVQLQGPTTEKERFGQVLDIETTAPSTQAVGKPASTVQQIFIVHGHDAEARDQLELALRRLEGLSRSSL